MPIDWGTYAKIRAMHAAGGMSDRQIARALGIGRKTVARYRSGGAVPDAAGRQRESPVRESVEGELKRMLAENAALPRKQRLSARGMWEELMRSGVAVSEPYVRGIVRELRDSGGEEFVPLLHEKGASAQFDWGDAAAEIAGVKTAVSLFVTALPHSNAVCAFCYPDKKDISFLHGHTCAFEWMGGVPRQGTYDNLRSAVLSGHGAGAIKQDGFKRLEAHYGFEAVFCNIAAGWEKSNVENGVRIVRKAAFTPMPRVESWDELQSHVSARMLEYNARHRIQGEPRGIWESFLEERAALMPLPKSRLEICEPVRAKVRHDQTVAYDGSRYSVPHGYVGMWATLRATPFVVEIHCRGRLLHTHKRALSKGTAQYVLEHYLDAISRKPRSAGQALPIVAGHMPPQCREFLAACPSADAERQLVELMLLAREVGAERVLLAMDDALKCGRPTADLVKLHLEVGGMPSDAFAVEHADLRDYDRLIAGRRDPHADI